MAKESPTPIQRGPGSASPDFTAPSVPVVTPGRQLQQTQPTEFERFRDVVLTAARGAASAVSARAQINSRLKQLKERAASRVEQDLNRSARHFQRRRLEEAVRKRQAILVESETRGVEYAEREFRARMTNAGSVEESQLWEQAWQQASKRVDRENEEARRQQFNSAARTMEHVSLSLRQELTEDPALEAQLIGDGTNIGARVQNWMLQEIGRQVNLDEMTEEDADVLIHQAVKQSFSISDKLTSIHTERTKRSNEILGTQQIEADIFSTLNGDQESNHLNRQIEVSIRDRLNHLTPEQQIDYVRRTATESLMAMADGKFGIDALDKLGTAVEVLDMRIEGEPVFGQGQRQQIAAEMLARAERSATREMQAEIGRLREQQTEVVTLADGTVVHRPSLNPDAALATVDPETGLSPVDEAANKVLADMGLLGDVSDFSPEAVRIVAAVRMEAMQIQRTAMSASNKKFETVANANTVFSGLPGGDANDAQEFSFERRAYMNDQALVAAGQSPISGTELQVFKQQLRETAATLGLSTRVIDTWDGSTLEYTDENRELNRIIAASEAFKWSNSETQAQYGMPSRLVRDKLALLRSNDPNRLEAFAHWVNNLNTGANEAWDNFLSAEPVSGNDAAAAQWVRVHARLGQPTGNVEPDYTALMAQVQQIQNAQPVGGWFRTDTGDIELETSNAGNMAQVMAEIISDESGVAFEPDERDRFNRRVQAQLQKMFLSDTNTTGRMLRNLWFAGKTVNQDLDDAQIGTMVWQWLRKDGHRFRSVNDRAVLVVDPQNYTGEAGQDISDHVDSNFTREFSPEYRSFLIDALDIEPKDAPRNLQHLFLTERFGAVDPTEQILQPRWSFNEQVTDRLLESRAGYGGFVIQAQAQDGTVLPLPVSKKDAILTWYDGQSVFVPKGTVLSVINPDLYKQRPLTEREEQDLQSALAPSQFGTQSWTTDLIRGPELAPGGLRKLMTPGPNYDTQTPFGSPLPDVE